MLAADDECPLSQRHGRTEEQIRRRVKRLGIEKSMEGSSLTAVDYTPTYNISTSSNDNDMEMPFKSDEQPPKSNSPGNKKKSGPRKLIKLKRKSVVLTDGEGESEEIPRNIFVGDNSSIATSELSLSYPPPKEKKCLRQRIIVDDDSDEEDGE